MIIGLSGRMRSGKDTACSIITDHYSNCKRIAFADKLKDSAAASLGVTVEQLEEMKTHSGEFHYNSDGLTFTHPPFNVRTYLQRYGSEAGRSVFGDNFWVENAFKNQVSNNRNHLIVTDVRFPNEANYVLQNGGIIIRIIRTEADAIPSVHVSEQDMSKYANYVIENNGTTEELRRRIIDVMNEIQSKYPACVFDKSHKASLPKFSKKHLAPSFILHQEMDFSRGKPL